MSIARYLEDLHPDPPFLGRDPLERAQLDMWSRQIEFGIYTAIAQWFRHTSPHARALEPVQVPAWGALSRERIDVGLRLLDRQLERNTYIAGADFSFADITLVTSLQATASSGLEIPSKCANVKRWFALACQRPSVVATLRA